MSWRREKIHRHNGRGHVTDNERADSLSGNNNNQLFKVET